MLTNIIKQIIPQKVWKTIRRWRIISAHKRVALICHSTISKEKSDCHYLHPINKDVIGKKIIWQYWAQGYDNGQVPELVRVCLDSVERHKGDYTVIRLTDENLSDYISLPDYVQEKREHFPRAIFSDLLRTMLLATYGGVWLDATVLLTGPLPARYEAYDFFMFQRDNNEAHQNYWESVYAYYYGWDVRFKVRVLNSIIFAKTGSIVMNNLCQALLTFWKDENTLPDYFFYQILFHELINGKLTEHNCPIESDCRPHYLQQLLNDNFPYATADEILQQISIHKLSYKTNTVEKLRQRLPNL